MFYTYLWLRDDGTPYYVGKGTGSRAFVKHATVKVPPRDRIIVQEFLSDTDALEAEKFLISYYGRSDLEKGCLRNYTDGGEGLLRPGKELREKLRNSHLGHKASEETKIKMSLVRKGKKLSLKHVEAIRKAQTTLTRKHKSEALTGKPWTKLRRNAHIPTPIISWYKPYSKWRVRESITGKHMGYFSTFEEASSTEKKNFKGVIHGKSSTSNCTVCVSA